MKTKRQKTTANGHLSRNSNHRPSTGQATGNPLLFSDFGLGHVELMRGALAPSTLKSYTSEIAKLARYAPASSRR